LSENRLAVEEREGTGKSITRKLRRAGRVPAVIYGHGKQALSLSFDPDLLERLLKESEAGLNTLIGLEGSPEVSGRTVLVKELQRDPVRGDVVHVDLFEVDPEERIVVAVPIHVHGIPEGVTMGGLLDHALREIEVDCLPSAIPDSIDLDVASLSLGDSVHVRDLVVGEGIEVRTQEDLPVVSVVMPTVVEEEPEAVEEGEEGEGVEGEEGAEGAEGSEEGAEKGGGKDAEASGSKGS